MAASVVRPKKRRPSVPEAAKLSAEEPSPIPLACYSALQLRRLAYTPRTPDCLACDTIPDLFRGAKTTSVATDDEFPMREELPRTFHAPLLQFGADGGAERRRLPAAPASGGPRVGVVFCGRQSPGGHNVVAGVADMVRRAGGECIGFVGGTIGMFEGRAMRVTEDILRKYRNQGGYHMLGRSADQVRTPSQQEAALRVCNDLRLDGLVMVGGTHTMTDAAHLAEYMGARQDGPGVRTAVVSVPASIDNDVHNAFVETTLGFDTATRTFAQLVGNTCSDAASAAKHWFFIRLMGRRASHVTLECALQTKPNVTLLGESVVHARSGLQAVVSSLADLVAKRSEMGKDFGVVLLPEGLVAAIPELQALIDEINAIMARRDAGDDGDVEDALTPWSRALLAFIPPRVRAQLLLEREVHGTVQLSQVATEEMLAQLVGDELARRKAAGRYGGKWSAQTCSFGYQARSALPSVFDCDYGHTLGMTAAALAAHGASGYTACVRGLEGDPSSWVPLGVPTSSMMAVRPTSSGTRAIVPSEGVSVHSGPAKLLWSDADECAAGELYRNPGPVQFEGSAAADSRTASLRAERHDYLERIARLGDALHSVRRACRPGVSEAVLDAALTGAASLETMVKIVQDRDA